jgi:hypothetical protein
MRFKPGSIHENSISPELQAQSLAKSGQITPERAQKLLGRMGGPMGAQKHLAKRAARIGKNKNVR